MYGHRYRGFTLAEVMVVIAIIALLMAIILPSFGRVFAIQRRVTCASHLDKLGQGYGTSLADRRMAGHQGVALTGREWQRQLLTYVGNSEEVFQCPEDDGHGLGKKANLSQYYMDVFRGGGYDGSICLDEDESSEWVWKLSGTQFSKFSALVSQHGPRPASKIYNHPGYIPDDNPDLYYFSFEDMAWAGNADRDFWDLLFKIETVNGMDLRVTIVHGVTGYTHDLYLGAPGQPDRQLLFKNCKSHAGESILVKGEGASSYGLNSVAERIQPGTKGKILIMDYERLLAAGSPCDESGDRAEQLREQWEPDPNDPSGPLRFARHLEKCNVLFPDGSVKLIDPDDIHPSDPEVCEEYWNP
jgi:prepilin-type N-terminal cleavage/methylation domain-containing protein/prepilin-type processing-associated H-X9-DG protein